MSRPETHVDYRNKLIAEARQYLEDNQKNWTSENDLTYERMMRDLADARKDAEQEIAMTGDPEAAAEARAKALRITAATGAQSRTNSTLDVASVRTLVEPIDPAGRMSRAASIPLEFRTEYPVLTSDSSHTYGSYATPTTLARECVIALVSESAVLDAQPRILRTTTGETVDVPVVLSGGLPSATYRAEGAAADQDTPVFSKTTLHAYHLSGYIEVSQEFLTDALSGDAEAIIGRIIGAGLGSKLATELAVGDGSDHVDGVFNAPTQGVPAAASETYTADELLALRASVTSANRKGARWLFSDAAYSLALTMKASDGTYLIQPSPTANAFDTLWGQPVHVDAYGPALTTGLFPVLYGRFDQAYCVRFAGNLEISSSDDVKFTSWTRTYRYGVRVDAGWLDTAAVKAIELS